MSQALEGRPVSKGPAIVEALEGAGFVLWAEGPHIMVTPPDQLTAEQRALIAEHRDQVLARLRARDLVAIMRMDKHPCTACAGLERGLFCAHYGHVMPEPARPCRCCWYKAALPW